MIQAFTNIFEAYTMFYIWNILMILAFMKVLITIL